MTDKTATSFSIFNDIMPDDAKCGRIIQQDLCLYIKWDEPPKIDEYGIDECEQSAKHRTEAEIFSDLFIRLNVFLKRQRTESAFKLDFMDHNQLCVIPNTNSSNKHVNFLYPLLQTRFAVKNKLTHRVHDAETNCPAKQTTTAPAAETAPPPPPPPPLPVKSEKPNWHQPVDDDDESVSSCETEEHDAGSSEGSADGDDEETGHDNYALCAESVKKAESLKNCSNVKSEWDDKSLADSFTRNFGDMMKARVAEQQLYEMNMPPLYSESLSGSVINNIGNLGI